MKFRCDYFESFREDVLGITGTIKSYDLLKILLEKTEENIEYKEGSFEKISVGHKRQKFSIRLLNVRKLGWNIKEKLEFYLGRKRR